MIDNNLIDSIDKSQMLKHLLAYSSQCKEALEMVEGCDIKPVSNRYYNIVFLGMGGSAIGGDIIKSYLAPSIGCPLSVNRNYDIPAYVGTDSLVFCCSYSGNTEETIAASCKAISRGATVVMISSGGQLEKLAQEKGLLHIAIPKGLAPRCALTYLTIIPLKVLEKMEIIPDQTDAINEVINVLDELTQELNPEIKSPENQAKVIAGILKDSFPVIYAGSDIFVPVAYRWKCQIHENSKQLAWHHFFPEMNHNEIVGWENPQELMPFCKVILLRDAMEHERIRKRIEIIKSLFSNNKIRPVEVFSRGKGLLARLFSFVHTGDFVSFYLAMLNGVDPTPVAKIDYLKKSLGPFEIR